jgi:hypothetical protein
MIAFVYFKPGEPTIPAAAATWVYIFSEGNP